MDSAQDAKNNAEALRKQVSKVQKVTQPKLRCKNVDGVVERRDGQLLLLDYTRHEALGLVWENPAVGERGDAGYRAPQWSPVVTRKRNECWRRHRALSAIPTADAKAPQEELDVTALYFVTSIFCYIQVNEVPRPSPRQPKRAKEEPGGESS